TVIWASFDMAKAVPPPPIATTQTVAAPMIHGDLFTGPPVSGRVRAALACRSLSFGPRGAGSAAPARARRLAGAQQERSRGNCREPWFPVSRLHVRGAARL